MEASKTGSQIKIINKKLQRTKSCEEMPILSKIDT